MPFVGSRGTRRRWHASWLGTKDPTGMSIDYFIQVIRHLGMMGYHLDIYEVKTSGLLTSIGGALTGAMMAWQGIAKKLAPYANEAAALLSDA